MIVIKGNMPKRTGCDGCEFQTSTCEQLDACTCHLFEGTIDNFHNERHKDCPIIGEIPDEHGDLIDRDYVKKNQISLNDAPTVLEANNGDSN